jgi:hypothetical protein
MDLIEQIKGEFAAFAEKKKALTDQLKGEFPAILKPLFEKYPSVEKIRWRQYTPYFNDGDECTFSAHVDSLAINDDEPYETSDGNEDASEEFTDALGEIPEEMLKEIFGDHVMVIVNRDGTVETEEYEHD